ncbi:tRNA (adenosine(37)-N6)-threonylcarbamoyltransferase complex ATPase subunit type 1 TsaE [Marixanthomonas sp. SCSIO 43207]|uniref:tRNA (adenosine(37)-N6)-threonylcarbamoyltransferase complex ATPase subunit type 1 TsaE n=1 Tax=Marixanthomonas sp. SCSIO 43207 TaxID=2779360 RepID=UPI001CA9DC79|nr:tRNA (adenosine(37)-N6)-threonylcarbamoyltransferase complex ATPase subunit type 1 TsaE [Marixanthomonas sp. SCSIO 43207]UAB80718.1 tRNA (adenosine(37)-N6)-threonylcarbamoyltransferase complex ATPase subunit type 1 TsaE [Marixanthomonas sp. SCSIO 43207]
MEITYTLNDLQQVADKVLTTVTSKHLLFDGAMGTGKTTLIAALAKKLGVSESISSPTFSLVNEYQTHDGIIYHFDFYRIEDEKEALDIGVEEYLYSNEWVFIEWPEKIKSLLPEKSNTITITKNKNGSRTLSIMPVK